LAHACAATRRTAHGGRRHPTATTGLAERTRCIFTRRDTDQDRIQPRFS
jgi:hypothetical protein